MYVHFFVSLWTHSYNKHVYEYIDRSCGWFVLTGIKIENTNVWYESKSYVFVLFLRYSFDSPMRWRCTHERIYIQVHRIYAAASTAEPLLLLRLLLLMMMWTMRSVTEITFLDCTCILVQIALLIDVALYIRYHLYCFAVT